MSQRFTTELKPATVRRTLQRFWSVTREQPLIAALSVFTSAGYILLLTFANTYVMGLIVDRVQAGPVPADQVVAVFWPYVAALVVVNLAGQILSKLQDYTVYKLEINGNYRLSRLCFNTLSNQSMTFHTNRFGGSLVSQTSRFTNGYTALVDVTVYSLIPTITSVVCTVAVLAPVVPLFTAILVAIMAVYVAFVWYMYKKILPLSAATSKAQNRLSGVLSDAVTNILAVKTCGREDFERELFDAADRDARDAETVSMRAMMRRNFTTSGLIVLIMGVVSVFVAGGNAWFGISAGTLVVIFTYTYNLTMRLNYVSSMMQRINRALGDAAEMTRVLDEPLLVADAPDAPELRVSAGAIDFEELGFAYRDAAAGEKVFSGLTLHIPAGQRVGLVGRSGSGKTTLTKLLLRLGRRAGRPGAHRRAGRERLHPAEPSPTGCVRATGGASFPSLHSREHLLRPSRRHRRANPPCGGPGQRARVHRPPAARYGHDGGREGRQALRRPAPARGHRPRHPRRLPDSRARRGHERARLRVRGARARRAREPHARPHVHRRGAPPLDGGLARPYRGFVARASIVEDGTHEELVAAGGEYAGLWGRQTGAFLEA